MSAGSTEQRVRAIVAQVAKVAPEAFGMEDHLPSTLGLDSLSALRVIAGIEREFGVLIPDDRLHELPTLRSMLDYLDAR